MPTFTEKACKGTSNPPIMYTEMELSPKETANVRDYLNRLKKHALEGRCLRGMQKELVGILFPNLKEGEDSSAFWSTGDKRYLIRASGGMTWIEESE